MLTSSSFLRSVFTMDSLQQRRTNAGLVFLYKLLKNLIDSPFLLQPINLYYPDYTSHRSRPLFFLDKASIKVKKKKSPLFQI